MFQLHKMSWMNLNFLIWPIINNMKWKLSIWKNSRPLCHEFQNLGLEHKTLMWSVRVKHRLGFVLCFLFSVFFFHLLILPQRSLSPFLFHSKVERWVEHLFFQACFFTPAAHIPHLYVLLQDQLWQLFSHRLLVSTLVLLQPTSCD